MKRFIALILVMVFSVTFLASCKETNTEVSSIPSASSEEMVSSQDAASSSNEVSKKVKEFDYASVPLRIYSGSVGESVPMRITFKPGSLEEIKEDADLIIRCKVNGEHSFSTPGRHVGIEGASFFFHTPVEVLEVYKGGVSRGNSLEITGQAGYIPEVVYEGTQVQYERIYHGLYTANQSTKEELLAKIHYSHIPLSYYAHEKAWLYLQPSGEDDIMLDGEEYIVFLKDCTDDDGTVYHLPYGEDSILLIRGEKCYFKMPLDLKELDDSDDSTTGWYSMDEIIELIGKK